MPLVDAESQRYQGRGMKHFTAEATNARLWSWIHVGRTHSLSQRLPAEAATSQHMHGCSAQCRQPCRGLQAKKRSRASGILAAASARAAEAEGGPVVELSPAAVTLEAGSPPAELLLLRNSGTAAATFSLAHAAVRCWINSIKFAAHGHAYVPAAVCWCCEPL